MSNRKVFLYSCCVIVSITLILVILTITNNAPFRWSRKLCNAIRMEDTTQAIQLIVEGKEKGYSLNTLSEPPSFIWTLLETTPETPLQTACKYGNYIVAEKLILEGASVSSFDGGLSWEPILCVLNRVYMPNDKALVELLINNDAALYDDSNEFNPMIAAAYRAPLNFDAKPDTNSGKYPYDETVAKGISDVFMVLAEHYDCYTTDIVHRSPLHYAVLIKNWNLVCVLVNEFDYSLDSKDIYDKTAYDLAIEVDAPSTILQLLQP